MSNSALVQATLKSPNHSGKRTKKITGVVVHHVAGVVSVETLGRIFLPTSRQASSNYGIGYDGRIGLYVDEDNRSWCTSSNRVDQEKVTIEVSNSSVGGTWPVIDHVLNRTIELIADIYFRNGIYPCTYTGNEGGNLWLHKWYAQTSCPGPYLTSKMGYIASEVTKRLNELRKSAPSPISTPIRVGARVRIKADAKNYANTPKPVAIPNSVKGNYYTIQQMTSDKVLLKEIVSWVYIKDLIEYQPPKPSPKPAAPATPRVLHTKVLEPKTIEQKPHIVITKDGGADLWAFDVDNWGDVKSVKRFNKGEELEVKAIVTNKLGSEYYITPYSHERGIRNGINKVDAKLIYKEV